MSILSSRKRLAGVMAGAAAAVAVLGAGFASADHHGDDGPKRAQLGEKAPHFEMKDLEGNKWSLKEHLDNDKVVVLEWFNPECPFVVKHHYHHPTMRETYKEFKDKGVVWVAINSGAPGEQGTGLDKNKQYHKDWEMPYPILLDEESKIGRMYGARVTPHMFIISKEGVLVYDGAIDNNRSARTLGETNYVRQALREHFNGETVSEPFTRPYGCTVKYADGVLPERPEQPRGQRSRDRSGN